MPSLPRCSLVVALLVGAIWGVTPVATGAVLADVASARSAASAAESVIAGASGGSVDDISGPGSAAPTALPSRGAAVQIGPELGPDITLALPENSGTGRRVVYSNKRQRIWVVDETETVIKTHLVSGRTGYPVVGTYRVYSRSIHTFAEHNPSIIWNYMVRFATGPNGGAVGFHEIPDQCSSRGCFPVQTVEQLGTPLSGGCLRQATEDAIWMWEWATLGTTVVVVDNG